MKIHNSVQHGVAWLAQAVNRIAAVMLVLMMLLTVCDVLLRKIYGRSILGTVELTEFMLVGLVFFSLAHTEIQRGHVRIDFFMQRVPLKIQSRLENMTQLLCVLLFGAIAWSLLIYAGNMCATGDVSQDLWIPIYPFIYVAAAGNALLSLSLLVSLCAVSKKRELMS